MYKKLTAILLTALVAAIGALIAAYFFTRKPASLCGDDDDVLFI